MGNIKCQHCQVDENIEGTKLPKSELRFTTTLTPEIEVNGLSPKVASRLRHSALDELSTISDLVRRGYMPHDHKLSRFEQFTMGELLTLVEEMQEVAIMLSDMDMGKECRENCDRSQDTDVCQILAKRSKQIVRKLRKHMTKMETMPSLDALNSPTNFSLASDDVDAILGVQPKMKDMSKVFRKVTSEHAVIKRSLSRTGGKNSADLVAKLVILNDYQMELDGWDSCDFFQMESRSQQCLSLVFMKIWIDNDLRSFCKTSTTRVWRFAEKLEKRYLDNPYHNRVHAAEVVSSVYFFYLNCMKQDGLNADYFNKIDLLVMILAAAAHDVAHPGLTNDFLIKTGDLLALRYNDKSVLENFHAATTFELMQEERMHVLSHTLPSPPASALRVRVIEMILATDMAQHKRIMDSLAAEYFRHDNIQDTDKLLFEQVVLHMADIAHPLQKAPKHRDWSARIEHEFFLVGDREKDLGFVPMALFDREKAPPLADAQVGFLNFVVKPTWSLFTRSLSPDIIEPQKCLSQNIAMWENEKRVGGGLPSPPSPR